MNNYDFCADWIADTAGKKDIRVLDYGCGAGEIVKRLREKGIEAFGCDVFYGGGDYSSHVDPVLMGGVILRMDEKTFSIPFESGSFDYVINNQVMEHVEDIGSVLGEIQRVLKPGGSVLSLFPDKGVWREGHCGIPFLHWFSKGSSLRIYYAAALRVLGLGKHKGGKSAIQWSRDVCEWLDKWTFYRSRQEIISAYDKCFCDVKHISGYWLQQRLGSKKVFAAWLPEAVQQMVVEKLGCWIFVARKQA